MEELGRLGRRWRRRRRVVRRTSDIEVGEESGGGEVKALAMDETGLVAGGRDGRVHGWSFLSRDMNPEFFAPPDR